MGSKEGNDGSQEKRKRLITVFLKKKKNKSMKDSESWVLPRIENLNMPFDSQLLLISGLIVCKDSFVSAYRLPII